MQSALLAGLAFDEQGSRLTPTYASRRGRRYRYYVSAPLTRGEHDADGIRVPATDLEDLIIKTLEQHLSDGAWMCAHLGPDLDAIRTERLIAAARTLARQITTSACGGDGDDAENHT